VASWKQQFFDPQVNSDVPLSRLDDGRWSLPVAPLRVLYTTKHDEFLKLTQLFRLFGIVVHVAKGQGLFGSRQLQQDGWQVVISTDDVKSWRTVASTVSQSLVLRTIPHLGELVANRQFEGLVINQLKTFNVLLDVSQVRENLIALGMQIEPVVSLTYDEIGVSQPVTKFAADGPSIESVLNSSPYLIKKFHQAGMFTLNDVNPERLQAVYQMRGVGAGKVKIIQDSLLQANYSGVNEACKTSDQQQETVISSFGRSLPHLASQNHYQPKRPEDAFLRGLRTIGVERLTDVLPSTLQHLRSVNIRGGIPFEFLIQEANGMASLVPDVTVYTAILPAAEILFESLVNRPAPATISLRLYSLLIGCIWTLPKKMQERLIEVSAFVPILESLAANNITATSFNAEKAESLLHDSGVTLGETALQESVWVSSLYVYRQLLPGSIDDLLLQYWKKLPNKVRDVVYNRVVKLPAETLQEIAARRGITRERVRQLEKKAGADFVTWWQTLNLSLKLAALNPGDQILVEDHFSKISAALLIHYVKPITDGAMAHILLSKADREQAAMDTLRELLGQTVYADFNELKSQFADRHQEIDTATLKTALTACGFKQVVNTMTWTLREHVATIAIVRTYIEMNHLSVIRTDKTHLGAMNEWAQHYFGRIVTDSPHTFNAALSRMNTLIPTDRNVMRVIDDRRFADDVLAAAKDRLDQRFAAGYKFARDNWLLDQMHAQFASQIPADATSDEFYQVFKRRYPETFKYSEGRSNDIFPKGQELLSVNDQIEYVARTHTDGVDMNQLRSEYGWELYTIQQAASITPSIYVKENRLFWVNVSAADSLIKPELTKYLARVAKEQSLISVHQVYEFFNEFMMDQDGDLFDELQIFNRAALASYLAVIPGFTLVSSFFLIPNDDLPELPRQINKVWIEYLDQAAAQPVTEHQLTVAVKKAGMSENTWAQQRESKKNAADIVPVSNDHYIAGRNLLHTPELDKMIMERVNILLQSHNFVALRALTLSDFESLPSLHNRQYPEQVLAWTPEAFISYAGQLCYRRLTWPKNMHQSRCDVLITNTSPHQSMQELMASLLMKWLRTETSELTLYQRAVELGLVPARSSNDERHFSGVFLSEQGFVVDGLGNMRRQLK
jgi:hypothetical protein